MQEATIMRNAPLQPTRTDLERIFRQKYGDPNGTGPTPGRSFRFGYFPPDDYYDSLVASLVTDGCAWVDVGGGESVFPDNPALAQVLAGRCSLLVGVDPSDTLDENPLVHRRVKSTIENYVSDEQFDLATLRMVAEHIANPEAAVASLARLLKTGGKAVVYTINLWTPVSIVSWLTPFGLHHPIKRYLWNTEEQETFPVCYQMNTRKRLSHLFKRYGFRESYFDYLDDCWLFYRFQLLNWFELSLWRLLKRVKIQYPENRLLGVYEKLAGE
jgi:SAM-dependent methyltransferase